MRFADYSMGRKSVCSRVKDGEGCGSIKLIFRASIHYGQSRSDPRLAINMACSLLETKTLFGKVILLPLDVLGLSRFVLEEAAKGLSPVLVAWGTGFLGLWGCGGQLENDCTYVHA
jgi:hypothetical protein